MSITGKTSKFPAAVDLIPNVVPYSSDIPGYWGDIIAPQYVNHVADAAYTLETSMNAVSSVTLDWSSLETTPGTSTYLTGNAITVQFTSLVSNVTVYSMNTGMENIQKYSVLTIPAPARRALGITDNKLPADTVIQAAFAGMRPVLPINPTWLEYKYPVFPYLNTNSINVYFGLFTTQQNAGLIIGPAYVSCSLTVIK